MATPVIMPKQGQSVETCIITRWFKKKGDKVATGDILFSYETDKASFDLEAPAEGILLDIFYSDGAEVPVLMNVAVIGAEGENTEGLAPEEKVFIAGKKAALSAGEQSQEIRPSEQSVAGNILLTEHDRRIRISPRARKLAHDKDIDYKSITGTGPNGRIVALDILNAGDGRKPITQASSSTGGYADQPLSNVRRIIARTMQASLQNAAQLTHHMSADVRSLLAARQSLKDSIKAGKAIQDISLNDMVCWCVIKALQKYPEANSHFLDDHIRTFSRVDLAIAVDTTRGLMVPVVKNASDLDISQLSAELKNIAGACKKGNINPELLQSTNASFTVSNLGNYGVEMFTPVINLPQVAILGVCTITYRPADIGNGIIALVPYIGLSLTYDHRAIDGGPATSFLREIKTQIEAFRLD